MNVIEAAKSGRPFKRPCHGMWFSLQRTIPLNNEDLLADDWTLREPALLVQPDALKEALRQNGCVDSFERVVNYLKTCEF